jgi:outer membrane protein assembly factor BamE
MMPRPIPLTLLVALLLAGCSTDSFLSYMPEPYKVTIQQGNVITQEMVEKLKPGMTKSQVRFVLGSPPVTDIFHANRWDYVYNLKVAGDLKEERKLTLYFENDLLTRVAGDVVPMSAEDKQASAAKPAKAPKEIVIQKFDPNAPPIPPEDEKGFFGRMLDAVGL